MAELAATTTVGKAQQFSESQSKGIAELRAQVADIIEEASEASSKPVGTSLWGVELVAKEGEERDLRVDVILAKFLKARNGDVKQAREMLRNTLKWRAEFGVSGLLEEEFPKDVFGKVGHVHGRDREGRPVTYNYYGGLDNREVFGDLDRFLRWRVQVHERGMQQLDFVDVADMVQVHDYEGVGVLSYDKFARAASKATVQLMSDNYPETLAVKVFANVPGWGETIFNVIGRWLSEETKKKFVVVSKASAAAALAQRIDEDQLPDKFRPKKEEGRPEADQTEEAAPEPQPAKADAPKEPAEDKPAEDKPAEDKPAGDKLAGDRPAPAAETPGSKEEPKADLKEEPKTDSKEESKTDSKEEPKTDLKEESKTDDAKTDDAKPDDAAKSQA